MAAMRPHPCQGVYHVIFGVAAISCRESVFLAIFRSLLRSFWFQTSRLPSQRMPRILTAPGETESGSAGKQPDKGYPGRRCAKVHRAPGGSRCLGPFYQIPLDTGAMPQKIHASNHPSSFLKQKKILLLSVLEAPYCFRWVVQ